MSIKHTKVNLRLKNLLLGKSITIQLIIVYGNVYSIGINYKYIRQNGGVALEITDEVSKVGP